MSFCPRLWWRAVANTSDCDTDAICAWLYGLTGLDWIREWYFVLASPVRIALIVLLAVIARAMLNHAINKIVSRTSQGKVPAILRPLREDRKSVV